MVQGLPGLFVVFVGFVVSKTIPLAKAVPPHDRFKAIVCWLQSGALTERAAPLYRGPARLASDRTVHRQSARKAAASTPKAAGTGEPEFPDGLMSGSASTAPRTARHPYVTVTRVWLCPAITRRWYRCERCACSRFEWICPTRV